MPIKAVYTHCERVYAEMMLEATAVEVDDETVYIYEGFTTKLFEKLGLSMPHYSAVLQELKRMGCVEQVKRGGGGAKSVWKLLEAPTLERFEEAPQRGTWETRKQNAELWQAVRTLRERVETLEKAVF